MEMRHDSYTISSSTLKLVLEALSNHWFSDGGYTNNDEVITASKALESEIRDKE